jgi:hypothetical protein
MKEIVQSTVARQVESTVGEVKTQINRQMTAVQDKVKKEINIVKEDNARLERLKRETKIEVEEIWRVLQNEH